MICGYDEHIFQVENCIEYTYNENRWAPTIFMSIPLSQKRENFAWHSFERGRILQQSAKQNKSSQLPVNWHRECLQRPITPECIIPPIRSSGAIFPFQENFTAIAHKLFLAPDKSVVCGECNRNSGNGWEFLLEVVTFRKFTWMIYFWLLFSISDWWLWWNILGKLLIK